MPVIDTCNPRHNTATAGCHFMLWSLLAFIIGKILSRLLSIKVSGASCCVYGRTTNRVKENFGNHAFFTHDLAGCAANNTEVSESVLFAIVVNYCLPVPAIGSSTCTGNHGPAPAFAYHRGGVTGLDLIATSHFPSLSTWPS